MRTLRTCIQEAKESGSGVLVGVATSGMDSRCVTTEPRNNLHLGQKRLLSIMEDLHEGHVRLVHGGVSDCSSALAIADSTELEHKFGVTMPERSVSDRCRASKRRLMLVHSKPPGILTGPDACFAAVDEAAAASSSLRLFHRSPCS